MLVLHNTDQWLSFYRMQIVCHMQSVCIQEKLLQQSDQLMVELQISEGSTPAVGTPCKRMASSSPGDRHRLGHDRSNQNDAAKPLSCAR